MQPVSKRHVALVSFTAGLIVALVLATIVALISSALHDEFNRGALIGFGVGLGIILGSTLLNAAVGLLDAAKKYLSGSG